MRRGKFQVSPRPTVQCALLVAVGFYHRCRLRRIRPTTPALLSSSVMYCRADSSLLLPPPFSWEANLTGVEFESPLALDKELLLKGYASSRTEDRRTRFSRKIACEKICRGAKKEEGGYMGGRREGGPQNGLLIRTIGGRIFISC